MPHVGGKNAKKKKTSSSDSKRHFTVVMGNKEHGLYVSSSPSSAARKAVSKLCAMDKKKKVQFSIREITQGSKKKTYGPYLGVIEKLKEPIELKGRVIRYKPVAKLNKKTGAKMKGGEGSGPNGEYTFNDLNNKPSNVVRREPEKSSREQRKQKGFERQEKSRENKRKKNEDNKQRKIRENKLLKHSKKINELFERIKDIDKLFCNEVKSIWPVDRMRMYIIEIITESYRYSEPRLYTNHKTGKIIFSLHKYYLLFNGETYTAFMIDKDDKYFLFESNDINDFIKKLEKLRISRYSNKIYERVNMNNNEFMKKYSYSNE